MDADPILRAFGKAAASHRSMHDSAPPTTAPVTADTPSSDSHVAPQPGSDLRSQLPSAERPASTGTSLPLPAPRQRIVHHGYQKARQELDERRQQAAEEAAAAQQSADAAQSAPEQATPPQHEADVAAARLAAENAWQQAALAAQAAIQQPHGQHGSAAGYGPPWPHSGWHPHPGYWGPGYWDWSAAWQQQTARPEPPPQPPPPPSFAVGGLTEQAQQSSGSSGNRQTADSAGHSDTHKSQGHMAAAPASAAAAVADSDEELAGLLMAWYNAGFETGRRCERQRHQAEQHSSAVVSS